jgi:3-hydroxyacyl-CoA dehydrogenase
MKNIKIKKVAVVGSGIMGSRIACHLVNVGMDVLLLDISPAELNEKERKLNKKISDKDVKNRIVNESLLNTLKAKPSSLFLKSNYDKIKTGNLDDDISKISSVDWIIEAVVEKLSIKKTVYDLIEKHRNKNTIISTNTSGIPISQISEKRTSNFKEMFLGTHFFNPPRYLRLLEIIPGKDTKKQIIDFFIEFGSVVLGKETVLCKDTPAFIANRLGIYSLMSTIHSVEKNNLSVSDVDFLTGTLIGRPKSATFRTMDVVGLDTAVNVSKNLLKDLKNDESVSMFELPTSVKSLYINKQWGDKTGRGFYKKEIKEKGKRVFYEIDLKTLKYKDTEKTKDESLLEIKKSEQLEVRIKKLINLKNKYGDFYRSTFYDTFRYCSLRIPEVSDEIYKIDNAICSGFGWKKGPFETWDIIGVEGAYKEMIDMNLKPAEWVKEMLSNNIKSFYRFKNNKKEYYNISQKKYCHVPGQEEVIQLDAFKENDIVWTNKDVSLYDIKDGILNLEFHTKMNSIGEGVLMGINKAIDTCEKDFKGLVISNEADYFSAGADLGTLFMLAGNRDFKKIEESIRVFQNTMMRVRHSSVPIVVATSGITLGGGCELSLHADSIQAHSETYMGLVELGAGLIPAGGGTKELVMRTASQYGKGDPEFNKLMESFMNIASAKVSTSAKEAVEMGYITKKDKQTTNRKNLLKDAKNTVLNVLSYGYIKPTINKKIKVHGRSALAMFNAGVETMKQGKYISEYDQKLAQKLAYIMCGGDLTQECLVEEQYLLDLEREAFVSLCGEQKTLERMHSILFKRKPLRN